jgi:hypothetical protein
MALLNYYFILSYRYRYLFIHERLGSGSGTVLKIYASGWPKNLLIRLRNTVLLTTATGVIRKMQIGDQILE